ncbi:DUF998 domain-containing protein [Saccharibacillus sp. CPCC 101409]|uniref:DUF998 domain-containing protein n=1 Tax=Saccharibacillus sp. CPCC 101409 TaxID=3058041 RepID=UPI0026737CCB|nr:DUF998 domain-containing protein [Saccharibacillus sp. CPCC 101409]MDO3411752.1 DUF998 domain-containing protein [Saccharibacillus sp. CPCC 101409]
MNVIRTVRTGAALFLTASIVYLASETIAAGAWTQPAYRYAFNNISDLGVRIDTIVDGRLIHSPLHAVMNAGFALQGLLFLLAHLFILSLFPAAFKVPGALLAFAHGIGMVLVAAFHGVHYEALDPHVIGAGMAIVGGNAALMLTAAALRSRTPASFLPTVSIALGGLGIAAVVLMVLHPFGYPAVFERISVYAITLGQALAAVRLLRISLFFRSVSG